MHVHLGKSFAGKSDLIAPACKDGRPHSLIEWQDDGAGQGTSVVPAREGTEGPERRGAADRLRDRR